MNHFLGVLSAVWVDGLTLDIQEFLGQDGGTVIDWKTRPIELSTKHFLGNWHSQDIACKFDVGSKIINRRSSFENLDHCSFTKNFQNLAFPDFSISQTDVNNFGISIIVFENGLLWEFDVVKHD